MRRHAAIVGYDGFYGVLNTSPMNFRSYFLATTVCRLLEANRITFHTEVHFKPRVVISVTEDEFVLVQLSLPANLSLAYIND